MFKDKILKLQASITEKEDALADKTATIKNLLEQEDLEQAKELKNEIDTDKTDIENMKKELALYNDVLKGDEQMAKGKPIENKEEMTYRERINNFIRTKGTQTDGLKMVSKNEVLVPYNEIAPTTDGVVKTDTKPVTSEEILTTPVREVKTVTDLKQFVNVHNTTKGSGKYPILKRATSKMISVAELEKNPKLAKPEFDSVDWEVATYRGAIPLSQEAIDDADVDLVSLVAENANEIKLNTTNDAIAQLMKKFTAKTVTNLDDLKAIFNVDLDPAYDKRLVVSQTMYNWLDTLKDENGRYLMQDSIISPTGKVFGGNVISVLPDAVIGKNAGFVGDSKNGILFANRKDLGLRWVDNEIYGQYLQVVARFDVKIADKNAGYYVTVKPAATDPEGK